MYREWPRANSRKVMVNTLEFSNVLMEVHNKVVLLGNKVQYEIFTIIAYTC